MYKMLRGVLAESSSVRVYTALKRKPLVKSGNIGNTDLTLKTSALLKYVQVA